MTDAMTRSPGPRFCVLVDHRESRSAALSALQQSERFAVEMAHLTVGDYQVDGCFVFERKGLLDLAGSIQDGRLFRQARALADLPHPLRGAFILEGTSADLANSRMGREAIQGALISVTLFFGIPVLRSMNAAETADVMYYAARQGRWFCSGAIARHGKRPRGKRRSQLALLQGLPGVGPGRAAKLLEHFGSVENVMVAGCEELARVDGVGFKTAKAIRWIVQEAEQAGYGE